VEFASRNISSKSRKQKFNCPPQERDLKLTYGLSTRTKGDPNRVSLGGASARGIRMAASGSRRALSSRNVRVSMPVPAPPA
jgi:hypothetical protein